MNFAVISIVSFLVGWAGSSQTDVAFSSIWNVENWEIERLENVGITISSWTHELQTEDPALGWVEVSYDDPQHPKGQDVLMTVWIYSKGKMVSAFRAQRGKNPKDNVSILLTINKNYNPQSYLNIICWQDTSDGGHKASGYQLSIKRIMELANQKAEQKSS